MSSVDPPFRRTRTIVISAVIVVLAAAAHIIGGGDLPDVTALMPLAALVTVPVAVLTARRMSTGAMVATLGSGQLVLHEAFMYLTPTHTVGMDAHGHGMAETDSPLMLAAHLLATIATAVVLAKNEAALFALISWLRPLVQLPEPVGLPQTPLVTLMPATRWIPSPWDDLKIHPLRGPPVPLTHRI